MTARGPSLASFFFPPSLFLCFFVGMVGFAQVIFHSRAGSFFPLLICMQGTQPRKPGVFKVSLQGNGVDLRFFTSDQTDHVGSSFGKSSSYSYSNPYQNPSARGHNIPERPRFYDQIKVICVLLLTELRRAKHSFHFFSRFY